MVAAAAAAVVAVAVVATATVAMSQVRSRDLRVGHFSCWWGWQAANTVRDSVSASSHTHHRVLSAPHHAVPPHAVMRRLLAWGATGAGGGFGGRGLGGEIEFTEDSSFGAGQDRF